MGESARWRHDETLHAWWVEPGRLLAGEYPGSTTPGKTELKVRLLVDAGIGSIVDLTTPHDQLDSYWEALQLAAQCAGREVHHFSHPIPDNSVIDRDGYDWILACIRDETAAGRIVYVHCWGGKGRTSTVVGCLLIDDGLDYDATIARIAELRRSRRATSG
jgi:protein-tyrosine phosphatase